MRRRILHIPAWYPTSDKPTHGIFIREHVEAASDTDRLVFYVTPHIGHAVTLITINDHLDGNVRVVHVTYRSLGVPGLARVMRWGALLRGWQYIKHIQFKPDLIHAHVCLAGPTALFLGRLARVPVILSEHWSRLSVEGLSGWLRWSAKLSFERSARVLPVSHSLAASIRQLATRARIEVIPNAVDDGVFHMRERVPSACPMFLTVANLVPIKGIDVLLRAFASMDPALDYQAVIVGDGPQRSAYEQLVVKLNVSSRVTFVGRVAKTDVANLMRRAIALVVPSRWETQGCVALEALAMGLPVVGTAVGGLIETVQPGVHGALVPPDDADALARALEYALRVGYRIPPNVADGILQAYGKSNVGARLEKLYETVIHEYSAVRNHA